MNEDGQIKVSALILAAGEGKRFGGPKALARFRNETFLQIIARNLRGTTDFITVVGGAEFEKVKLESERLELQVICNEEWAEGQFTSLKAGLQAIADDACCVIIALVDHPFVAKKTYSHLKNHYFQNPGKIIIPTMNGRRGHPIIIPINMKNTILGYPDSSNLRDILKEYSSEIIEGPVADAGILRDIDTRQNLEEREWA